MITFTEFQQSRRTLDDLSRVTGDEQDNGVRGYVYNGETYMDIRGGVTGLTLHNETWIESDGMPLEMLEAILYAWCITELPQGFGVSDDVHRFLCELQNAMTPEQFARAILANRAESNYAVCHMHDYCDANQCALNAAVDSIEAAADLYNNARPFIRG